MSILANSSPLDFIPTSFIPTSLIKYLRTSPQISLPGLSASHLLQASFPIAIVYKSDIVTPILKKIKP